MGTIEEGKNIPKYTPETARWKKTAELLVKQKRHDVVEWHQARVKERGLAEHRTWERERLLKRNQYERKIRLDHEKEIAHLKQAFQNSDAKLRKQYQLEREQFDVNHKLNKTKLERDHHHESRSHDNAWSALQPTCQGH